MAQTPAAAPASKLPDLPDEDVICTFDDGVAFTMGEFRRVYGALPPDMQQMALRNRAEWLHEYSQMRKLIRMAEESKLDQTSSYKEALTYSRLAVLSQAQMMETNNSSKPRRDQLAVRQARPQNRRRASYSRQRPATTLVVEFARRMPEAAERGPTKNAS